MKNRWQDELRRELKPVRVDDSLKMRILAEAERARFRRRRQRMAMAAVAAVLVAALGLTAALANLRPAVPDRRALSGGSDTFLSKNKSNNWNKKLAGMTKVVAFVFMGCVLLLNLV